MSYFDVRLKQDTRRPIVWREVVRYLKPWIAGRARVLEIGAGYCSFINEISAKERTAMDQDPLVKEYAHEGINVVVSDLREGLKDIGPFDLVLASNLFEHFTTEEFELLIKSVKEVLVSGGRLIAIQPNFRFAFREYFDDYTHKKIFTDEGLCGALEAEGFRIVRREARFLPFSLKSSPGLMPESLLPLIVRLYLASPWRPKAGQMLIVAEKT